MQFWSAVTGWMRRTEESGIGPYQDMDTISMLLTGWVIFILISVMIVKFMYYRFVKKTGIFSDLEEDDVREDHGHTSAVEGREKVENGSLGSRVIESITGVKKVDTRPQAPTRRKRLDKGQSQISQEHDQGFTGPDPKVVQFVEQVYTWAFQGDGDRPWTEVKDIFVSALNQSLHGEGSKVTVTDLVLKEDLKLFNTFAECISPDNVKVTSDCELQLKGEVTVTQASGEIKRRLFYVDRISGRVSCLMNNEDKSAVLKLDGWPEICVAVSDGDTLDKALGPEVGDALALAIRNTIVEIGYGKFKDFPTPVKFSPKRSKSREAAENRYLLLTVIKGRELGVQKGCEEAYCAIELDDPPQKFQTDVVRSHDPVWNENFVFNVVPNRGELLIEVHDKVGARFLGCNIISVDEIRDVKVETLKMKSRKMEESDQYSGSIDVQFTPLSEPEFLKRKMREKQGTLQVTTTRTVFTRSPDAKSSTFAENVIKELGGKVNPNANKSTLTIYAVQRENSAANETVPISQYGEERGRRRTRKGDIFTSIRRRFSKGRSHSVVGSDKTEEVDGDDQIPRSVSADRQSMISTRLGLGSARSSTSELSGVSGFSTTTFVHENSTLVIECVENRIKKYFLVPPNLAETGQYKKRGKKLHIYNDHTFVAKRLPSGTICEICTMRLPFSLGKQGYQCRDCKMQCHKECHVRAPSFCPKTSIYDIELTSLKQLEAKKPGIFSSLFGGKKAEPKSGGKGDAAEKESNKAKKKKPSTFKRLTGLGKISEENLLTACKGEEEEVEEKAAPAKEGEEGETKPEDATPVILGEEIQTITVTTITTEMTSTMVTSEAESK